jgi:hypothetical protein
MTTLPPALRALVAQPGLPHLSKHDIAEIDAEIKAALTELGDC